MVHPVTSCKHLLRLVPPHGPHRKESHVLIYSLSVAAVVEAAAVQVLVALVVTLKRQTLLSRQALRTPLSLEQVALVHLQPPKTVALLEVLPVLL